MSENETSASAVAILLDDRSLIKDESPASRVHNRGYFGTPLSGGGLELDLIETAYLSENGRLEVLSGDGATVAGEQLFVHCTRRVPEFGTRFLVYRDLRGRGLVVKPNSPCTYKTYPRGSVPGKVASDLWVDVVSERDGFVLPELFQRADHVAGLRKRYVLAIVDEEGDLTYYEVARRTPGGKFPPTMELGRGQGLVVGDKVLLWDGEYSSRINSAEFYGKMVSASALGLSLFEAMLLLDRGALVVHGIDGPLDRDSFLGHASSVEPDFEVISAVYADLKGAGLLVKTGFKYGSHFRAYKDHPDESHSQYLIWAARSQYRSTWPEIGRAIRLAHTVNKDFIIGSWDGEKVDYLGIGRVKP